MRIGRRSFVLGSLGGIWLAGFCAGCSSDAPAAPNPLLEIREMPVAKDTFAHGVASGDPLSDRVILWTRVSGRTDEVTVKWTVSSDPALQTQVQSGSLTTKTDKDFTVKVDVTGLTPGTTYYYAFAVDGGRSITGRTRTLPSGGIDRARFAFTSCTNYNNGFFNAYRAIARRADLDVWIHLGDYIYEYADGVYGDAEIGRSLEPKNETVTLADYRSRYAHYHKDADLQELHRQHPLIAVWDDHETANDSRKDGAENHQAEEGDWNARKGAAVRAFIEWLPVRVADEAGATKIYRTFAFGDLFDLIMLDTRLVGRDKQIGDTDVVSGKANKGTLADWSNPARTLLGSPQEEWLKGELAASKKRGAKWRLLGNQVIFSPVKDPRDGLIVSTDMWDGYQSTRTNIATHIQSEGIDNLVILTGDIHTSWAFDVTLTPYDAAAYDPATGKGAFAVEFVGPAVTSLGLETNPLAGTAAALLKSANPHLKFNDVTRKGYVLVDVTKERVQAEWYFVADHKTKTDGEELGAAFTCAAGTPHLSPTETATTAKSSAPPLAPA